MSIIPDELFAVLPDDVDLSIVWVAEQAQAPGMTTKVHENKYVVALNASWFGKLATPYLRNIILKGVLLHELLHVRFTDFDMFKENQLGNPIRTDSYNPSIFSFLFNLLEDLRIEYLCLKEYMSLAKYLSVALAYVSSMKLGFRRRKTKLRKSIEAIYQAARFGSVDVYLLNEDIKEDLHFVLPRLFIARRGASTSDMFKLAESIYAYLDSKYYIEDEDIAEITSRSAEQVSELAKKASKSKEKQVKPPEAGKENVDVLPWKTAKSISEDFSAIVSDEPYARFEKKGALPQGVPDYILVNPSSIEDLRFYINTVRCYEGVIKEISRIFAKKGLEPLLDSSTDGELNLKFQQEAFIDSYTFDLGGKFYLRIKKLKPALDICILLDQSGSMEIKDRCVKAAEACVILLEALKPISAIRTSVVGFGGGIRVLKDFHEEIAQGRFYPQAMGGTPLGEALKRAYSLSWRASERKSVILITDGYPDSWEDVDRAMSLMRTLRKMHIMAFCLEDEVPIEYLERFRNVKIVDDLNLLPRLLAEEVKEIV